jgi:hypothetical protein
MINKLIAYFVIFFALLSRVFADCPEMPYDETYKRYRYQVKDASVIAYPYLKKMNTRGETGWCLVTRERVIFAADNDVRLKVPLDEDREKKDFVLQSENEARFFEPLSLTINYANILPVGSYSELISSATALQASFFFALPYFFGKKSKLFFSAEAGFENSESKPGTGISFYREWYAGGMLSLNLYAFRFFEIFASLGGGTAQAEFSINHQLLNRSDGYIKTTATLRFSFYNILLADLFAGYRINPSIIEADQRLLFGAAVGIRF